MKSERYPLHRPNGCASIDTFTANFFSPKIRNVHKEVRRASAGRIAVFQKSKETLNVT